MAFCSFFSSNNDSTTKNAPGRTGPYSRARHRGECQGPRVVQREQSAGQTVRGLQNNSLAGGTDEDVAARYLQLWWRAVREGEDHSVERPGIGVLSRAIDYSCVGSIEPPVRAIAG